jgi:hypothetical protein
MVFDIFEGHCSRVVGLVRVGLGGVDGVGVFPEENGLFLFEFVVFVFQFFLFLHGPIKLEQFPLVSFKFMRLCFVLIDQCKEFLFGDSLIRLLKLCMCLFSLKGVEFQLCMCMFFLKGVELFSFGLIVFLQSFNHQKEF